MLSVNWSRVNVHVWNQSFFNKSDITVTFGRINSFNIPCIREGGPLVWYTKTPCIIATTTQISAAIIYSIWAQTSTTHAPAQHLQCHARISERLNFIHKLYVLVEVCLLWMSPCIKSSSSCICITLSPSTWFWMYDGT